MKKLLLVLLLLGVVLPAGATVLVYDLKESWTGVNVWTGGAETYKGKSSAYFLVEDTGSGTAEVRVVWFDKKDKWAEFDDWGEHSYIQATVENEKQIVVVSASGDEYRLLLNGASKAKKIAAYNENSCGACHSSSIGDIAPVVPASLSGLGIWDESGSSWRDMWTSKFTLKLNTRFTLEGHLHDGQDDDLDVDDTAYELLVFLESEGYEIDEWP